MDDKIIFLVLTKLNRKFVKNLKLTITGISLLIPISQYLTFAGMQYFINSLVDLSTIIAS